MEEDKTDHALAEFLVLDIESKIRMSSNPLDIEDLQFQQRLVQFAREKHISLWSPDWKQQAIWAAVKDHPKLQSRRSRGRPAKHGQVRGILDALAAGPALPDTVKTAMEWVERLDARNEERRACGQRPWRDSDLAKDLVRHGGTKDDDPHFKERVQVEKNRLSLARAVLKKPAKQKRSNGDL